MRIWLDIHLSPDLADWISSQLGVECSALRNEGHQRTPDETIFSLLKTQGEVVMSKDSDFPALIARHGPPPQVIWLRCGNTSNEALRAILTLTMPDALELLIAGEPIVEIRDR